MQLLGKVALITGGAQGLGRAFAEALLERGAKVSLVDINRQVGQEAQDSLQRKHGKDAATFTQCDVTNKDNLKDVFRTTQQKFGGVDIVVNNAGIGDEINWERTVAINLVAVVRGCEEAMKYMRKDLAGRGGLIINISSLAGLAAPPAAPVYTATKHGVLGFTRSLAATFPSDRFGVRISCLCPSYTDTQIMTSIMDAMEHAEPALRDSAERLSQGVDAIGLMQPADVVKGFLRLVDDDEAHGAVLLVTPAGLEYKFPRHMKGKL